MFQLALRNILRHGRRSLLTAGGMALALALMLTSMALNDGAWADLIDSAIRGSAGHVVVQADGWQTERTAELAMSDSAAIAGRLADAYPEATVLRRTFLGGLLTAPRGSMAVELRGIEPELEATAVLLDERLTRGEWPSGDRDLLIGEQLAEVLQVEVGARVVFMAAVGSGDVDSRMYRICGVFRTGSEQLDAFTAFAPLSTTQPLLPMSDPAHQIAVILPSVRRGMDLVGPAHGAVGDAPGLHVLSWRDALPTLQEQADLDEQFSFILYGFMGLIVAVGVLNTVLMSVLERVRELGVLMALGMRPREVAGMVVIEGGLLGLLGGGLGIALATPFIVYLQRYGLDYGDMLAQAGPVADVAVDPVLRAQLLPGKMFRVALVAALVAVLASLWPARHATRLRVVDALRHT